MEILNKIIENNTSLVDLYHISSWEKLNDISIILKVGNQNAEGKGVYFSENKPRNISTAEGTRNKDISAVINIKVDKNDERFWKTKNSIVKKFNRPKTYHTKNKDIKCKLLKKSYIEIDNKIYNCEIIKFINN